MKVPTIRVSEDWRSAMAKARTEKLRCIALRGGRRFLISSASHPGEHYTVDLDAAGIKIDHCDCPDHTHRRRPCKHMGRVAIRLLWERKYRIEKPAPIVKEEQGYDAGFSEYAAAANGTADGQWIRTKSNIYAEEF